MKKTYTGAQIMAGNYANVESLVFPKTRWASEADVNKVTYNEWKYCEIEKMAQTAGATPAEEVLIECAKIITNTKFTEETEESVLTWNSKGDTELVDMDPYLITQEGEISNFETARRPGYASLALLDGQTVEKMLSLLSIDYSIGTIAREPGFFVEYVLGDLNAAEMLDAKITLDNSALHEDYPESRFFILRPSRYFARGSQPTVMAYTPWTKLLAMGDDAAKYLEAVYMRLLKDFDN